MTELKRRYLGVLSLAGILVALDQLTKLWIIESVQRWETIPVIEGLFNIVHVRNRGAVFGFLNRPDIQWQTALFIGASVIATAVILLMVRQARPGERALLVSLGLVLGGAVGNLIDRIRFAEVVDFLDFYIGAWHWPAFNVADIGICLGAFGLVFAMYRQK